jgi:threonine dehydrogenase-like Zn-dependent dehydrogenase
MKSLQVAGRGDLRLLDLPVPEFGPDEVLIEVAHAGICHTDIAVLEAPEESFSSQSALFPMVPGHEWSGWVRQVGANVTRVAPGDLVTGETGIGCFRCRVCMSLHAPNCCPDVRETGILRRDGAMRQFHIQPEAFTHRVEGLTPLQAAVVEPASVAVYTCRRLGVTPADRVIVCGGGSLGQLCVQAARAFGARQVVVTSRSEPKLALARRLGADAAINVAAADLLDVARDLTDGEMFDVAMEVTGFAAALNDALSVVGPRGRVGVVGYASPAPYGYGLGTVLGLELSIIGVRGSPGVWPETISLMQRGLLQADPVVSHRFPLDQYQEAFELHRRGGPNVLKVMLDVA